ncbi:hypothetical protein SOM16_23035 [Pedobacter sp. CFBP9032]|nr:hypothetical protein [Pedobacter sp. CFBP9032]
MAFLSSNIPLTGTSYTLTVFGWYEGISSLPKLRYLPLPNG